MGERVMGEPLLVDCEGSACPGHRCVCPSTHGMCPMCGHIRVLDDDGRVDRHQRPDIIAMIARGDFDG